MRRIALFSVILSLVISCAAPTGAVFALEVTDELSEVGVVEPVTVETNKEPEAIPGDDLQPHHIASPMQETASVNQGILPEAIVLEPISQEISMSKNENFATEYESKISNVSLLQSTAPIVISQLYIGNASQLRLVEIYNNTDMPVDVTGWCIRYNASSTPVDATSERHCVGVDNDLYRAVLPARTHMSFLQDSLNGGLGSGSSGRVFVTDASKTVVDIVSWNIVPDAADSFVLIGSSAERPRSLERKMLNGTTYQDSDKSSEDMFVSTLRAAYQIDGIVELPDYCSNIDGLQPDLPEGFEQGAGYTCIEPARFCKNFPDIRIDNLLDSYEVDDDRNCYKDVCANLPEFQTLPPNGFMISGENCLLAQENLLLQISELLPNPEGNDEGKEYIELQNTGDTQIHLNWWTFYLNGNYEKAYDFPPGAIVEPGGYYVLYNTQASYTLTNNSGSLRLQSIDSQRIVDTPGWVNAKEGQTWALIGGQWQFTALPTPGAENTATPVKGGDGGILPLDCGEGRERNPETNRCRNIPTLQSLTPCKEGQYRSEETNRCRNIALAGGTLKPCAEGQYRSEETNRCRSIATAAAAVLKPCADDQFRNPETNRCKKIASMDDAALADCGEGRERNPETNRCRNVLGVSTSSATLPFPVEETPEGLGRFAGWWILGLIVAAGASYGAWEWRGELATAGQKAGRFMTRKK